MLRARMLLSLVFVLLIWLAGTARACPFCAGPTQTLAERYHEATAVVIAKAVPEPGLEATEDSTRFVITSIHRDGRKDLKVGQEVTLLETKTPGSIVLLMGTTGLDGETIAWGELVDHEEVLWAYIRQSPAPKVKDRLKYFQAHLEHADISIANDAWGEFANSDYEDIAPIAKAMSAKQLRGWLTSDQTPATRLALYGMMLGLCGGQIDMLELERRALTVEGFELTSPGIDGITGGYLLLAGEQGLTKLEKAVLYNPQASSGSISDRLKAIHFLWTYGGGKVPASRFHKALRPLLDRPELAEIVIADLARWKDYSMVDKIAGMYGRKGFEMVSQKRAVVRYLIVSAQDVSPTSSTRPAHAIAAERHIQTLKARDPKVVGEVLEIWGAETAAAETKAKERK